MSSALIVVDVQIDFFEGGALPVPASNEIIPVINKLRTDYEGKFSCLIYTQDYHPENHITFQDSIYAGEDLPVDEFTKAFKGAFPKHCVQNTNGVNFHPEILLKGDELFVRKGENKFKEEMSGFSNPVLNDILVNNEVKNIFVVGLCYDFCVGFTALDSASKGYTTYVIKDACKWIADKSMEEMEKNYALNGVNVITMADLDSVLI